MSSVSSDTAFPGLPQQMVGGSFTNSLDPRVRILTAIMFAVVVSAANCRSTLGLAMGIAAFVALIARLRPLEVLKRLAPVNLFVLVLIVMLPLSTGTSALFAWGPIHYSREGLLLAVAIALKANAIVLGTIAMLHTLSLIQLGHALQHLRVPEKLVHLLLFTVRYLDVLHGEYQRLRTAMKLRGFRPRANRHTYRALGYLVGMLLLRSLDRADRIVAAMKCRGFRGRFYLLDHFAFLRRDALFLSAVLAVMLLLALSECS